MINLTVKKMLTQGTAIVGEEVQLKGWVRTTRDVKACVFIELNDGSTIKNIQIVANNNSPVYQIATGLGVGAAIIVNGNIVNSPNANQPIEVVATTILVEGECPPEYPLQKKRHSVEYLRTIAHLRPRTNLLSAAFRIRSVAAFALHKYFNENDFIYCHAPLITSSDAEGAGEMFRVTTLNPENTPHDKDGKVDYSQDFFASPAFLTVSGQLQAETFAQAFGKTYTFGPTFRAENSNTSRHAAEFWMVEPEMAFTDLKGNMDTIEGMIKYAVAYVLEQCKSEIEFLDSFVEKGLYARLKAVADGDTFARITYTEAIEILEKLNHQFENPVAWGCDIKSEHERYLAEKHFKKPVFVTDYPKEIKSFYMRINDDGKTVRAVDLLVPGIGELVGGSQREEREDVLTKRMLDCKLDPKDYWWYLELRRYGTTTHSGFGIGFDRFIMYLTGISNIRDVLPFPRTVGTAEF